jgi:hypothetical protein
VVGGEAQIVHVQRMIPFKADSAELFDLSTSEDEKQNPVTHGSKNLEPELAARNWQPKSVNIFRGFQREVDNLAEKSDTIDEDLGQESESAQMSILNPTPEILAKVCPDCYWEFLVKTGLIQEWKNRTW